ncbi:DUF4179 domain-containing protein [Proteiniborus sp. MB09-C3]|uniref:DUF4179 domain-containing protein n=1 Tax=Proteiniborus sp. MB09-C3 TaxID=3050072 RepID=UPI0025575857|nr:DUF4179 domain-containing protein [Proteiniborus sp. MB09-C3]WIV12689.1 DUF4179 domain-containing protein [Proteiniborus sp. MB09-C3]
MKEIEKILSGKKADIDKLQVPEELESRLYKALENSSPSKVKKKNWKAVVAAACVAFLLIGYNFNALAYYGKKLLGYDQIMNGTLRQLNELGKGQPIGKSYTFKNGLSVTLDGIMVDENQLLAFYTIKDPKGEIDKAKNTNMLFIKGFIKEYSSQGGQGEMNVEKTEIKWVHSFEKPSIFEKTLHLKMYLVEDNKMEEGDISFRIDPNKAMGHTLKQSINKTIKAGDTKIHLESIVASPTKTVLHGKIQNIIELAIDQILGERLRPKDIDIKLIANGQEIDYQGGGMTTDNKGIRFHSEYDALPEDLESIQLFVKSFSVDKDVNKKIEINEDLNKQEFEVLGQNIELNKIYELDGSTYITITTSDDVILTKVGLIVDGERVSLKETINSNIDKLKDRGIMHTRTLHFPKTGNKYQLSIEKMTYTEPYNKTIDIPLD